MVDWLDFTKKMSNFGSNLSYFGKVLLNFITVVTVIFFWFLVFAYYQPYQDIAVFMIDFIRMTIQLFLAGYLLHYLFYFINEIIHRRQMKKVIVKVRGKKK